MAETRQVFDPFEGKTVEISHNLLDRLEGRYAVGPMLPNGEPEFGWRQHQTAPICHEAAQRIRALQTALEQAYGLLWREIGEDRFFEHKARKVLIEAIGKEGQRRAIEWVTKEHGAVTDREILNMDI